MVLLIQVVSFIYLYIKLYQDSVNVKGKPSLVKVWLNGRLYAHLLTCKHLTRLYSLKCRINFVISFSVWSCLGIDKYCIWNFSTNSDHRRSRSRFSIYLFAAISPWRCPRAGLKIIFHLSPLINCIRMLCWNYYKSLKIKLLWEETTFGLTLHKINFPSLASI